MRRCRIKTSGQSAPCLRPASGSTQCSEECGIADHAGRHNDAGPVLLQRRHDRALSTKLDCDWYLTRDEVEFAPSENLGAETVIWLPRGLAEDLERDPDRMYYGTDGHLDLFFEFIGPKRCLMLSVPDDDVNARHLRRSRTILEEAGIEAVDFPYMSGFEADGRTVIAPYLNFYVCNGAVIVPVAGADPGMDAEALSVIGSHWPGREVIGVPMPAGPMQGGAIHCMTQQVPAVG